MFKTKPLIRFGSSFMYHSLPCRFKEPGNVKHSSISGMSNYGLKHSSCKIYTSAVNDSLAKLIPLPENVEDIVASESSQFSPQRTRDISGSVILAKTMGTLINNGFATGYNAQSDASDPRLSSYDCSGPISLHSVMQTNVPEPFSSKGKTMHLNMPGGQWGQGYKYISEDLQNCHPGNIAHQGSSTAGTYFKSQKFVSVVLLGRQVQLQSNIPYSTSANNNIAVTRKDKLKRAVKEYGSTVIIFHVCISLLSLGGCYLAVSSGLDVDSFLQSYGIKIPAGASNFVLAYGIHKLFVPVRISITLTATPFIVRYLRKITFKRAKGI